MGKKVEYEKVNGCLGIRKKIVDGVVKNYEVSLDFGRYEVFDTKKNCFVKKHQKKTVTCPTLEIAKEVREKHLAERRTQKRTSKPDDVGVKFERVLVTDALKEFNEYMIDVKNIHHSTEVGYTRQLERMTPFFTQSKYKYVESLEIGDIEELFVWLSKGIYEDEKQIEMPLSYESIEHYKSHLKQLWDYMIKRKKRFHVEHNFIPDCEINAPHSDFESKSLCYNDLKTLTEEACFLSDLSFAFMVISASMCGLRRGEILGLRWKSIDFDKKTIYICDNRVQIKSGETIKSPKNGQNRLIGLPVAMEDVLIKYKAQQEELMKHPVSPDDFVFMTEVNSIQGYIPHTGKSSRFYKERYNKINKMRVKEGKEEIPYVRLHDLRHTFASLCLNGIPELELQPLSLIPVSLWLGHVIDTNTTILSVMLHCNEVYYPKWEETVLPNGEHKIRRLTKEESKVKAYIKPHFHIDYIPLTECEKDGIKYLKLCSNDIWKAEKGKYYNSYSEFNDRCYDVIGKEYGYERGTQWEEWNERIQKKRNGEKVKEQRKLHDFQIDEETKYFERYIKQLQAEYNVEIEKIAREYNSKKSAIQKKTEEYTIELMKIEKETADKIRQAHERAQAEYDAVIKELGLRNCDYPDNSGIFHSDLANEILR